MSQSTPHYIGNPLFEASTVATTSTTSTVSTSYYNQHDVASRRQAFVYGSSASSAFYGSAEPDRIRLRPRSHDMYNTGYYENNSTTAGRYLDVPSVTASYRYSVDGNLRSTPLTASSLRHHSIDSPEHVRRSRYHKSRFSQHHVSEILRDFQRHATSTSCPLTSGESHTRLLEADDEDYGQLYIAEEDEDKHNYYGASNKLSDFCDSDVPGPAPEVEPPRPAPKDHLSSYHYYDGQTSDEPPSFSDQSNRDLNDNFNDNHLTSQQVCAEAQPTQQQLVVDQQQVQQQNYWTPDQMQQHQQPSIVTSQCNGGILNNGPQSLYHTYQQHFNSQLYTNGMPLAQEHQASYHVLPAGVKNDMGVNLDMVKPKDDPTTYFNDGLRKIDFILVYEESPKDTLEFPDEMLPTNGDNTAMDAEFDQLSKGLKKRQKFSLWRQKFMASLQMIGLEIEEEVLHRSKNTLHFIRLHGPWQLLCRYAEELNLRAPIQAHPNPSGNWSEWILSTLRLPNIMAEEVPNRPLDYYTCPFKTSKLDKFLGSNDPNTFFSRAQRSRMVYEILATTPFGKEKKGEVGIERMVEEGAYSAAFPLHDGPFEHPGPGTPPSHLNTRQILFEYWARWKKWYKYQPLDHIREYFGEKIAIYFAWLGFYTGWLFPAAVVGVLVFLYGVFTMNSNTIAVETCHHGDQYLMCPLCETCDYWKLKDICLYKRIAYLFDHPGTVFYAIFMSFWAVTFLEYWKRKSASLAHHWDCMGFQEEEERPRPAFAAKAPYLEKNPITGVKEPSFPQSKRYQRIAAGTGIIVLMICLVLIFILAVIIYRTLVQIPLFQNETLRPVAQMIASMTGAMVNLVLIMMLGRIYEKLALRLTTWEMHRTQSEFDDNLTFKVFLFQFINFYSSIFYIAFFKGRFVGYPGNYKHIFGNLRNEDCSNGGCLIELAQQLAVIMVGKQIINNAQEILIPKIKAWWHNKKSKLAHIGESRMEKDYKLVENEGLFQEYLEMVLQFGFITIFVAAFPLAPFFALLNNWVEIRLDAQKFICETRRAVAERAENIGIWFKILDMLAQFAVITNAFLIAFTSEFIPKLVYKYEHSWNMQGYVNFTLATSPNSGWGEVGKTECRYRAFRDHDGNFTPSHYKILGLKLAFVIIFEHVVFGVCKLIDLIVPDIPESLDVKIKRERYLAKEALQDADHVLQKVLTDHDSDRADSDPEMSTNASPMARKRGMMM